MNELALELKRWGRRLGLEPLDLFFAGLRVATLAAGIAWRAAADDWTRAPQIPILGMFFVFSAGLYVLNAVHPGRLATLYRVALVFDLGIVFFLVRITGGFASDLHLAFSLLIALHAFYFGLATGLATAAASVVLYALAGDWPAPMPGFPLRAGFFALVGLSMGLLSEQARRRREEMEEHQEQMIRSDRLATVGELAAGLAHELRNPLAGISGALHVLGSHFARDDERTQVLADVEAQIVRMNGTLTELLRHARPAKPQRVPADINLVVDASLRFLPRGNVELVRQLDGSLPPLQLDPNLMHQVFLNVLVNARQAMPAGGRLSVRTQFRDGGRQAVQVVIGDTGVGIAAEHLGRIFRPFFTTKAQGTGLGLAIAARIVEQHGGGIAVDSSPGSGTTFTITLPASSAGAHEERAPWPIGSWSSTTSG